MKLGVIARLACCHQTNARRQVIISKTDTKRPQSNIHPSLEIEA